MSKFYLLGERLSHSLSVPIHHFFGNFDYQLLELKPNEVAEFLSSRQYVGLNVTIPYKQAVMPYLDYISPEAKAIGSVNTIVNRNGQLCGYNTDYSGFEYMLIRAGIDYDNKKVAILGTGGTSKTANALFKAHGCDTLVISRFPGGTNIGYADTEKYRDAQILVNTTPVGMYPDLYNSPIDLDIFTNLSATVDVIYNPLRTRLTLDAKDRGLAYTNGLSMLCHQAAMSHSLFFDCNVPDTEAIIKHLTTERINTVYIGMPGCGKTTIGMLDAKNTGRKFIDTDAEIEKKYSMSISEIFHKFGEERFRDMEIELSRELSTVTGCVIATGGGFVTTEAIKNLRYNSEIVYIRKNLDELIVGKKTLSKNVDELFRERKDLYEKYEDYDY